LHFSPEQHRGEIEDHRTDIWSVGVLLYYLLSFKFPFNVKTGSKGSLMVGIAMDIAEHEAPSISSVSGVDISLELQHVIAKALERDKTKRFSSARNMSEALERALVAEGQHFYHVFISYRVQAEKELANQLFVELSKMQVGAKGEKMRVYLDHVRLRYGEMW
jgi:serine/threonine protein kinase